MPGKRGRSPPRFKSSQYVLHQGKLIPRAEAEKRQVRVNEIKRAIEKKKGRQSRPERSVLIPRPQVRKMDWNSHHDVLRLSVDFALLIFQNPKIKERELAHRLGIPLEAVARAQRAYLDFRSEFYGWHSVNARGGHASITRLMKRFHVGKKVAPNLAAAMGFVVQNGKIVRHSSEIKTKKKKV